MQMHIFRPLLVVLAVVGVILLVRNFVVPAEFGAHERGYMYGWHNKADEERWKGFKIKFQGTEYCKDCHDKNYDSIKQSPHRIIECENCHGPAADHPGDPPKLVIDRKRALCLRCHAFLDYPTSNRRGIKGLPDPEGHNPGIECSSCHNPHDPKLGRRS